MMVTRSARSLRGWRWTIPALKAEEIDRPKEV